MPAPISSASPVESVPLPAWMSARRAVALLRVSKALVHQYGKLCLTCESLPRLAADLHLLPHEVDRAIDDLFYLKMIDVRDDGITSTIKLTGDVKRIDFSIAKEAKSE